MHMGSKTSDFWTAWKKPKGRDAVGQVGNVSGTELAVASGTQVSHLSSSNDHTGEEA